MVEESRESKAMCDIGVEVGLEWLDGADNMGV
jgi:hypothetical protein